MKGFQKLYCKISIIFACITLAISLALVFVPETVFAADSDIPAYGAEEQIRPDTNERSETDYGATDNAPNASDETPTKGRGFTLTFNGDTGTLSSTVQILLVLTVIALAPSILVMLTSFTRVIIVLHFIRTAIGTQTSPPNQVLIGLALFLTIFIMWPTFSQINENALQPLDEGTITQEEALDEIEKPFREFMYGQTQTKDLNLFCEIAEVTYEDYDDVPFYVLVPSFIISELRTAFIIGFLIYIPFIVIDMVVASVLMSMGMMMLPPTTISLPFKILLFVLADGWNLVIVNLVKTFY
ncbi:MAG: flagellar type III secretion system pore protein FliP [Lachnospiraceae bacterium]|jgi:flagellar biosynthetic protein FliP|nr:flagellar type III secretion system pore protein FliP [Lachnospiraceae bacterium]MBQ1607428.1 flagellar type III secretion system pore protein FliP [Lachnospiraceae bacterium]MBQ1640522.1 flagellar type III secretion system pore protein FliP [Lachnospiraceae bacterium]MBQ1720399.1 flagellar type III secretion system pore protein FliP [Lachnospiraceae bacterium]MBQ2316612.1 flagellar type III secretion system pore protein FliP [Lachnospiraceae bacterium]